MSLLELWAQRQRYLPLVFGGWAAYVGLIYFLQFPFPLPKADSPYFAYALLAWISLAAVTFGALLLRPFRLTYRFPAERLIFAAALGFGVIAYATLALGLFHLLYPSVMYGLLVALTVAAVSEMRPLWQTLTAYLRRAYAPTAADLFLSAILLFLLTYHFLGTMLPPVFFDSLVYHLAMPKLYVLQHAITYCPYNFYSNFPFTLEMLYTFGLALDGAILVKGLNYVIHLLMLGGLYSFTRTYFSHRMGLLSVLIFYTIPWVGFTSFLLYIEIGLAAYFWLAMYALVNWTARRETGWIVLGGILTGFMLGIKYLAGQNAVILGVSLIAYVTWQAVQAKRLTGAAHSWQHYRVVGYFALPALLVASPWYLKSWLWTGNPVFPFLFGGKTWDLARLQQYLTYYQGGSGLMQLTQPRSWLLLPWHLVFPADKGNVSSGPLMLIFLPLLVFCHRLRPLISAFLLGSALFLLGWASSSAQFRFLVPLFPFLSVVTAYALTETVLNASRGWLKHVAWGVTGLFLLLNVLYVVTNLNDTFTPFGVITGTESRHDYLSRHLADLYPITQYANETLPAAATILYFGETRGYYADRKFIANSAEDQTVIVALASQARNAQDLRAALRDLGVTHIILNKREIVRLNRQYHYLAWHTPADEEKFREFYRQHLKLLKTIHESDLLEIVN